MTDPEIRAVLSVALMAAFADGRNDDRERDAVKRLADELAQGRIDVAGIYQSVLLTRPALADVVAPLASPEAKQYAYELAVGIVHADGQHTPAEAAFLSSLAAALGLAAPAAAAIVGDANAVAGAAALPAVAAPAPAATGKVLPEAATLDKMIVDASITNAALELLPESLASMAILPLQMRLVYRIGQAYGYELGAEHAKDFLATLGVGLAGQYLEQFGRKLLGGLLGGVAGGIGRAIGDQTASSGLTFATTWAIGQVARQYYASGRMLDADKLKAAFGPMLGDAKALAGRYAGEIEQRAKTIDLKSLPALIGRS
jgi:uncharacterized protein (DUF697 family)/tellurite resistance protein